MELIFDLIRIAAVLFAVYCFLAAPNLVRRKLSNRQLTGWDYAHRGLYDKKSPENSLAAFDKAVQGGYGIELDVIGSGEQPQGTYPRNVETSGDRHRGADGGGCGHACQRPYGSRAIGGIAARCRDDGDTAGDRSDDRACGAVIGDDDTRCPSANLFTVRTFKHSLVKLLIG